MRGSSVIANMLKIAHSANESFCSHLIENVSSLSEASMIVEDAGLVVFIDSMLPHS